MVVGVSLLAMKLTGHQAVTSHHAFSDTNTNAGAARCTRTGYIIDDPVAVVVFVIADFAVCCCLRHTNQAAFLAV